ncbi:galanin receptor type 1-like [Anneissia japonica]|uniref:galanin receptor type 1-like n=1 Tax=Anneissia japonica TaxID=1529436 RepID=UPI001425A4DD|nr:galanin receptor type 1-like [Anneissia japonica]
MSVIEEGGVYDYEWVKANFNGTIYFQEVTNYWRLITTTCVGTIATVANLLLLFIIVFIVDIRKKPSMVLVANITIADLLMVLCRSVYIVLFYTNVGQTRDHTEFFCKFSSGTYILALTCSSYTLASLAVTRYQGIVRPFGKLSRRPQTFRHIVITSGVIWIFSILLSIPQYILAKNNEDIESDTHQCQYLPHYTAVAISHEILFIVLAYLVPLTIIGFCYGSMSHYLRKASRELCEMDKHSTNVTTIITRRCRLAKSFICIAVVFGFMYLPSMIYRILVQFEVVTQNTALYFNGIANIMCYTNTCVNPAMFCFFTKKIRQGFIDIFFCRWGKIKLSRINSTTSRTTNRT